MKPLLPRLALLLCALALLTPADVGAQPSTGAAAPGVGANPIPVTLDDPRWGNPLAPVTLVHFYDLQCPYSAKMGATLDELKERYGRRKLRIVYKQYPLPMHPLARPAAEAAIAVHRLAGVTAFERFNAAAFSTLRQSGDHDDALRAAKQSVQRVQRLVDGGAPSRKVDDDLALAKRLGVHGTPASYVNGVEMSGARPVDDFAKVIDQQLAEAQRLRSSGVPPARVYAEATRRALASPPAPPGGSGPAAAPAAAPSPPGPPPGSQDVWRVPITGSPALGQRSAWVTLVVFSDFQCPFCSRLAPTFAQLHQKYGSKLRIVFKHNPLPFHPRAEAAAQLSLEAFARQGSRGFWAAHDRLFAQQRNLEDADLEQLATELGLSPKRTLQVVHNRKHRRRIEADQALADELEARGTPTSYVNGRKITGARPLSDFEQLIDEELDHARELIAKGVPAARIYRHIQSQAKLPAPPEKKRVPRPTRAQPSRGPRHAPVTIQIFSDFECPFCSRAEATLAELEQHYGNKLRFVWRNMPLKFHSNARPAATLAAEAFRQQGDAGFWQAHDLLFANQANLERASLLAYAAQLGLDTGRVEQAIDADRHGAAIDRDLQIAEAAGISGTPSFIINGYFLSGAQPARQFRRLIDRALRERPVGR